MSKQRAARISNAQTHKDDYPDQSQFAGYTMEDWDDTLPDSFFHAKKSSMTTKDAAPSAGSALHGPGGLLSVLGLGTKRRKWGNRANNKACTCGVNVATKEQISPGVTRIRGNLCNVHGRYGPCDAALSGKKKPPKGRKVRKPAKAKITPEQRQEAKAKLQAENRAKVLSALGIDSAGQAALEALRSGQQADSAAIERAGLVKAGLAERAADGSYRLTASGRAALSAASQGDQGRAGATISSARDRTGARDQRQTAAATRRSESAQKRAAAQAERQKKQQAAAKKRSSGGRQSSSSSSSGNSSSSSSSSSREAERQADRAKRESERQADRKQRQTEHAQDRARRQQERDQDRAARQSAQSSRQSSATPARQSSSRPGVSMPSRKRGPRAKSFAVYKSASGDLRWIARSTTAYRDRDKEILTIKALDDDSARMVATHEFGPLRFWHIGQPDPFALKAPWGPGVDIGDCDYSTQIGTSRVESGTFHDQRIAQRIADTADQYELSPGFFHPTDQPNADGEYHAIRTFERSIVPTKYGRASNYFTGMTIKEFRMEPDEMERRFKAAIEQLQLSPDQAQSLASGLVQADKSAQAQGVAFKSDEPADPWTTVAMAIKAAMTPLVEAEKAPMDAASMVDAGETEMDDGLDDETAETGDYVGDLSVADFEALLQRVIAPLVKGLDIAGKMAGHMDELKSMMGGVGTKSEGAIAQIAALKAQQDQIAAQLKTLQGDQPSVILPDEIAAALKSTGPASPPDPDAPVVSGDPNRPFEALAALTLPQLYRNNPDGTFGGWQSPQQPSN